MSLLEQVKKSLKWKQSNLYCATKLGISVEKYKQLKNIKLIKIQVSSTRYRLKINKITFSWHLIFSEV